jgi:hypothetical protein
MNPYALPMRESQLACRKAQAHNPRAPAPQLTTRRFLIMDKRFFISWVALFVAWMAGSFVVHGTLLSADYAKLPQLFRQPSEGAGYMPFMLLAHVLMAGAFTWIYARGAQADRPWSGQGLRYGIAVALLTAVPTYAIYYAVQPMPGALVVKQIAMDGVLILILGQLVAWLYRPSAATVPAAA